jgi:hypothetical protein
VPINEDGFIEVSEDFTVNLSGVAGPGVLADASGTGTITDNDNYDISVDDVTVDESAGTATFTVSLDQSGAVDVSVDYATLNGTATAPGDYIASSGTLNFIAGTSSQPVSVTINEDTLAESGETFTVNLSNVAGPGVLADASGTGTITDNDYAVTISDASAVEGNQVQFTVNLAPAPAAADVNIDYVSTDVSATGGVDYTSVNSTLTIPAGSGSGVISVETTHDTEAEGDETFTLTLSNVGGPLDNADLSAVSPVTGTITDNDYAVVSISSPVVVAGSG